MGPAAIALQEPEWTITPSAQAEKSISLSKGSMAKILRDYYDNADANRLVTAVMATKQKQDSARVRSLQENAQDRTRAARYADRKSVV